MSTFRRVSETCHRGFGVNVKREALGVSSTPEEKSGTQGRSSQFYSCSGREGKEGGSNPSVVEGETGGQFLEDGCLRDVVQGVPLIDKTIEGTEEREGSGTVYWCAPNDFGIDILL